MVLFCSSDLFQALDGLAFPASKEEIVAYAEDRDALEASIVALNQLQEGVLYEDIGAICDNVKVVCILELYRFLEAFPFPGDREKLLAFAEEKGASEVTVAILEELPEGYAFRGIGEICEKVL
jgi:hypothetical protein